LLLVVQVLIAQSDLSNPQSNFAALKAAWRPGWEDCSGDVHSFWDHGKQIQYRACERLLVAVTTQPFFTNPLAYTVAVVNLNDGPVEVDYTNWQLRSTKGQKRSSVNPDQVAAKLRKRAGWAALSAGMGAGMSSSYYSATVTGPNGTSTIQGNVPPDSREVAAARQRAAAPLQNAASAIQDQTFRRTTMLPASGLLGGIFFQAVKGGTGTLTYRFPSGKEVDFTVRVLP
jgi:hypothetical protein